MKEFRWCQVDKKKDIFVTQDTCNSSLFSPATMCMTVFQHIPQQKICGIGCHFDVIRARLSMALQIFRIIHEELINFRVVPVFLFEAIRRREECHKRNEV